MDYRSRLRDKKRIVVKIGSSSLQHPGTGLTDLFKLEKLVRTLTNLKNMGKEVVLVSSGAIAVGKNKIPVASDKHRTEIGFKQACAAVGQAQLMMTYQKL